MVASRIGRVGDGYLFLESRPGNVPKKFSGLKRMLNASIRLGNGFYLTFQINQPLVFYRESWLGHFFEFLSGRTRMTEEKSQALLEALVTACEKVERGEYKI